MRLITDEIPPVNRPLDERWPRWRRDVWYLTGTRSPTWAHEALILEHVTNGEGWDW